ncbi:hypothetical protein EPI10_016112 [Gossypium australe]|uniref:Uncharacterized protein n=1 Tax=Gossypium australe TaxID=47621 RepID=A0A5B6VMD3_9ROSI|nr:hypothetical protein EPI10_016112 [Gossypium australe]
MANYTIYVMPLRRERGSLDDDALSSCCIAGANAAPVRQGLPLECGKEFRGVRGGDPTRAEYWLE